MLFYTYCWYLILYINAFLIAPLVQTELLTSGGVLTVNERGGSLDDSAAFKNV